ncbi:MAG: alpha/beta hydrolase [Deltaproteobacteria bacterium]|nr:alpha/beta hydrolase [Deltaproteobacteria bacterium]
MMVRFPHEVRVVRARDGQVLAAQVAGEGPAVLLANGIGVRAPGFARFVERLRRRHRLILWDYRGIGGSRVPGDRGDLSMGRHALDALDLLDALGEDRAAVVGWSMGVPVGLEMIRVAPTRVAAFAALFGSAGPAFRAGFPPVVARGLEGVVRLCAREPRPSQAVMDLAAAFPGLTHRVLSAIRFTGQDSDRALFAADVESVASAPREAYFRTLAALARHDARDVLPRVRCPALVIGGGRDLLTPPAASRAMAEAIPGARLLILPRATHFGLLEEPGPVLDALEELLGSDPPRGDR